jgi:major membrane immunogen (membrane-anchored lipoprotein)
MKIPLTAAINVLLLSLIVSASISSGHDRRHSDKTIQDTVVTFKDGNYEGKSQAKYIYEPYWGEVHLTLKNGLFTKIKFVIRDSNLHEPFDGKYEKHFDGNPEYIQQSRNDWKGVQTYPEKLLGKKDMNKLDAVSGATWSYNIFKASVNDALTKAK